jgi:hypothetical protein
MEYIPKIRYWKARPVGDSNSSTQPEISPDLPVNNPSTDNPV